MLKYHISFLLFIIHSSLISTPTCYISLEQPTQQDARHILHRNKQLPHYNSYSPKDNLFTYSTPQLHDYFDQHQYTENDILSQRALYMSDEFVQLAKTYPGYEKAITKLYKQLSRMCFLERAVRCVFSNSYYPNLLERIRNLHKELREYQRVVTKNAKSFAQHYDINLFEFFPSNNCLITRNIYKTYIDILDRSHRIPLHNSIVRDCIGNASSIGLEANKNGFNEQATQLANFCLTVLDCAIAFDEGIYVGVVNTFEAITHPVETIKNSLIGISVIVQGLNKLLSIPGECVLLYATDRDCFYVHRDALMKQLGSISNDAMQYIQTTPVREIVKQSSAFMAESVLLAEISLFAHKTSKQLFPIARNYFEYVVKNEPMACLADGIIVKVPKNINKELIKNIAHFNKHDTQVAHGENSILQHIEHHFTSYAEHTVEQVKPTIAHTIEPTVQQLKPLGRGSTGRTIPNSLHEKLVMEEAMAAPDAGFSIKIPNGMTDPRWHKNDGWVKMGWRNHPYKIEVHYVAKKINNIIVAIDDFKFKQCSLNI